MLYNPFERLTPVRIQQLIQMKDHYLIVQRFRWTGITAGSGFMASHYSDLSAADEHQRHLLNYDGKLIDLQQKDQLEKLLDLFKPASPYVFYINTLKDKNWDKKMVKAYAEKIRNYIRSSGRIKVNRDDGIEIELNLKYGYLIATIKSGEQKMQVPFYEIIK